MKRLSKIDPVGQVNDYYLIGTIDENYGKGLDAKAQYQKYLSKAFTGIYAQASKDRIAALTKNISDTQKIKSEAELNQEKQADDAYQQAVKLQSSSQFDAAIPLYKQAIQLMPKNADFVYSLGTCYQQKPDLDNAITCYQQAITMQPTNKDFQKALADAMEQKVLRLSIKALISKPRATWLVPSSLTIRRSSSCRTMPGCGLT